MWNTPNFGNALTFGCFNGANLIQDIGPYEAVLDTGEDDTLLTFVPGTTAPFAPPAPATPVPTMSVWGLGILAGLLGLMGFVRRRKA